MARSRRSYRETAHNPFEATSTLPNSEERIQAYRSRVQAHQAVFRHDDLEEDDRRAVAGMKNGLNGKPPPVPRKEVGNGHTGTRVPKLSFSSFFRLLRKKRGWTTKEVAARLGVCHRVIKYYEAGVKKPGLEVLERIVAVFEISGAEIFVREG
jgi:DNA-binding XRE family transcriptional regulator